MSHHTPPTKTFMSSERLNALARRQGISPRQLRALLIERFTSDIADEIGNFIDAAEQLDEILSTVMPQRGRRFADTLLPSYEALFDVKQHLERLARDPMAWPEHQ
ncbi:MAG: hypothetical protein WDA07_10955 [Leucobacter sp.]